MVLLDTEPIITVSRPKPTLPTPLVSLLSFPAPQFKPRDFCSLAFAQMIPACSLSLKFYTELRKRMSQWKTMKFLLAKLR